MTYTARRIAGLLDEELPWLSVRAADRVPGPDWISCAELVQSQQAGADPTAAWRAALAREYGQQYGVEPPVQVAAMFVLMWYVGVPALVAGLSGALTGVSPDVSPAALAFRRHPTQHFPTEVALLSDRVIPLEVAAVQLEEHTRAFLETFRPEVKLSSRQRYGAAEDELRRAIQTPEEAEFAKETASAFGIDLGQQVRTSCCFFYALPGVTPCGGCPRIC
ncbi:(2Fe-2S)-binding protein [Kribbella deserti]|uniref:(2Fe-2S)-binding protein n=1 Tax=Kribbella deserti TaxID=1926257 RepID=A0ABV6QQG3_9ACTN